jgi:hypothetical protein
MTETAMGGEAPPVIRRALEMESRGAYRDAIELLTETNRIEPDTETERELVRLRREGGRSVPIAATDTADQIVAEDGGGQVAEIDVAELDLTSLHHGLASSGCLLVRNLVSPERAGRLAAGIDASLAAYDAATTGTGDPDPRWYDPRPMPDREGSNLPEDVHRQFLRGRGSLWTADSPRMLFELFELVDDNGLGELITAFLGERPLLSGIKATMRRIPPDVDTDGRWHQDGSFLGERIRALNIWLALDRCGVDAPGLDIVPKRFNGVVEDPESRYEWSLSDEAVHGAADTTAIVRPEFQAGDALVFDHLLVHRTGASRDMPHERHAIESWFFAPSAYPVDQLPILY